MKLIYAVATTLVAMFFATFASAADQSVAPKQLGNNCHNVTVDGKKSVICLDEPAPAPHVVRRAPVYQPSVVTATACLTPEEWANCPTKRWWASSAGYHAGASGSWRSPYFFARCGSVTAHRGAPALWYNTSTGRQVWFRFG